MTAEEQNTEFSPDQVIEITDGTYWVGHREGTLLERNTYLRVFEAEGKPSINLLIDPGPPQDFMEITKKVSQVIGDIRNLHLAFLNHQDPDVVFNASYLQKSNPAMQVLCSEDTWRLVRFYDLAQDKYKPVERFPGMKAKLSTGHQLQFVPTPFCHFRGATMLYDLQTRILFTGDLFGGLSYQKNFMADENSWDGIKTFHQIYMPSREALSLAVKNIRALDPPPVALAPQHGGIISGALVEHYLSKLEKLPVGLNLILDSHSKNNYLAAMNDLLIELARSLGVESITKATKVFMEDGSFPNVIKATSHGISDIKIDLDTALGLLCNTLYKEMGDENRSVVDMAVVKSLLNRNIPLPYLSHEKKSRQDKLFA